MFLRLPRLGARAIYPSGVALLSIAFYIAGRYNFTLTDVAIGIWHVFLLLWRLTPWGSSPQVSEIMSQNSTTYVVNHQILQTRTPKTSSNAFNSSSTSPLKSSPVLDVQSTSPANKTALTTATTVEIVAVSTKSIFAGKQAITITASAPVIPNHATKLAEEKSEGQNQPANVTEQTSAPSTQAAVNATEQAVETSKRAINITTPSQKSCEDPQYKVRILSYSPLVIYIQNFVTRAERKHLIALAAKKYEGSQVVQTGTNPSTVEARTSSTVILEKGDPIIDCIRLRAARFQGKSNATDVEDLNIVRYQKTQKLDYHFDWSPELPRAENELWGRWTPLFVFLGANGTVGGTMHFPKIRAPENRDREMCRYVECEEGVQSLVVKPVVGNAVFWVNRFPSGKGDERSLHAGREVVKGTKIGMNIWTGERARDWFIDEVDKEL